MGESSRASREHCDEGMDDILDDGFGKLWCDASGFGANANIAKVVRRAEAVADCTSLAT